jgi:hypothetical protein
MTHSLSGDIDTGVAYVRIFILVVDGEAVERVPSGDTVAKEKTGESKSGGFSVSVNELPRARTIG